MNRIIFLAYFLFSTITLFGISADDADIVVALDGSGDFTKIQDAIDAVASNNDRQTVIYIKRGLYNTKKLIIPSTKKNICFVGESCDETIISYHLYDYTDGKCPTEDAALWIGDNITTSATWTIQADGFRTENLIIQNTADPVGQSLGITVRSDKVVFFACNILGHQDTIYQWNMDYAAISGSLHLCEYKNTGVGADMSGRAGWVGLCVLTDTKALDYTVQKVLTGSDNWDPTSSDTSLIQKYNWRGNGKSSGWFDPANWNKRNI